MNAPKTDLEKGNKKENIINNKTIRQLGNDEIQEMFLPIKNIESCKGNIFEFLKNIVEHTHKLVKKERMENEYIDKYLGKLSARELLSRGKTFYMNPCLDFTLITVEGLKRTDIKNVKFIVEELQCPSNRFKLHFGVEIEMNGTTYHIDHRTKNTVFIGQGRFESDYANKGEYVTNTIYIPADEISADDTIHTLVERGLIPLKFFDLKILDMLKEKLKQDNTNEQREKGFISQVKHPEKPEIFIKKTKQRN